MSVAVQNAPALNGLNGASVEQKKVKSKNQLRRQKAKQKKATVQVRTSPSSQLGHFQRDGKAPPDTLVKKEHGQKESENVEYVSEQLDLKGAALEAFSDVFARFQFEPEDRPVCI
jgi:splicing factor 3B subunit 2